MKASSPCCTHCDLCAWLGEHRVLHQHPTLHHQSGHCTGPCATPTTADRPAASGAFRHHDGDRGEGGGQLPGVPVSAATQGYTRIHAHAHNTHAHRHMHAAPTHTTHTRTHIHTYTPPHALAHIHHTHSHTHTPHTHHAHTHGHSLGYPFIRGCAVYGLQ